MQVASLRYAVGQHLHLKKSLRFFASTLMRKRLTKKDWVNNVSQFQKTVSSQKQKKEKNGKYETKMIN